GDRALPERGVSRLPLRDEAAVLLGELLDVPRALRRERAPGGVGGHERRGRRDAELGELGERALVAWVRRDPQGVVEWGEAEPAQARAQGLARGAVRLGDREGDDAPPAVPVVVV